jgi:hypothetical protein
MGKATTLLDHILDRHQCEENLKPADNLDHVVETSNLFLMFLQHGSGVDIRPELFVFAKRHVKLDGIGMVSLARKHSHRVMENVGATLNTLVQPTGTVFVLVDGDTVGLTTTVVYGVYERDVEFVGLFGEVMGTAHSCLQRNVNCWFCLGGKVEGNNVPAAPAPTTNTFFLFCPSISSALSKRV